MKKSLVSLGLVCLFVITGCATYIKVRVLKPAQYDVGSIRKIAISDFKVKGNYLSNDDQSLASIAANALISAITGTKTNNSITPSYSIKDSFLSEIIMNGHFKVIDKNNFIPILEYDNSLAKLEEIKKATDAEAILTGEGNYSLNDNGEWIDDITYKNGVKITNKKYRINRRIETSISYKFIDTRTGEVLVARTNSTSDTKSETGEDQDKARNNFSDWKNEVNQQLQTLVSNSVKQFAPYYVYEDKEIREGKSYLMKSAFQDAKIEKLEEAKLKWENLIKNKDSLEKEYKEDYLLAKYNLGVYYEINNQPEKAEQLFEECYKMSKDYFYQQSSLRANNRKFELDRLRKQNAIDNKK